MRTRWIGPVLLLASMLVTAGLPQDRAHARTRAGADVRIGQHEDFRRLVIEWDHPVRARWQKNDRALLLSSDAPLPDGLERQLARLADVVALVRVAPDRREATFELEPGFASRFGRIEDRIVYVDLLPQAPSTVGMRIGHHDDFVRLVFEPVSDRARAVPAADGTLRLLDAGRLRDADHARLRALAGIVAGVSRDGDVSTLELVDGVGAKSFFLEPDKLVVDLSTNRADGRTTAEHRPAGPATPEHGAEASAHADRAASAVRDRTHHAASDGPRSHVPGDGPRPPAAHDPSIPPAGSATTGAGDPAKAPISAPSGAVGMPHVDLTPVDVHPPVRVEELPILALPHDSGVELRFAWPDPVAAAVFRRAGQLWLVFHARAARIAADRTSIRRHARGLFESMGQEPHERATIFRLSLSDQVTARALFDGKGWRILLSDRAPFPRDAATRTVGRGLLLPGIEAWIDVTDPLVGDRLGVGLTTNAELGSSTGRSFVDLELLPAALGRVWVPRAGDLEAQIVQDGLLLSRTEGLHVAPSPDSGNALGGHEPVRAFDTLDEDEHAPASHPSPSDRREREPTGHPTSSDEAGAGADHADTHGSAGSGPTATAAADHAPADAPREARTGTGTDARTDARGEEASTTTDDEALLGLKAAPLLANQTLLHRRRELIGRLVDERAERRLGTLIDLARLHLALGQGAEARTYLARADLLTADDPALAGAMGARRRALAAVAGLLMGREPDAAVLLDAHHDDDPEIRLWRSAFDLGDPSEDPGPADDRAMIDVLQGYSVPLQIELGLRLVDRFSTAGRANAAFTLLGRLERLEKSDPDEARFRYAQGSVFAQDGDLDAAVDRWRKGVTRARGITLLRLRAALAQAEVATGALDLEAAVEQLRADRASWRGHPEEWELQRRLGALESQAGHAARALESWQKAVEQAPSPRLAGEIIDDMQRLFVEVLTSSGGWRRSPLQALALYRRYRELLPEGEAGDRLVSTLIDELEGAGFTEAAIAMLERRSTFAGGDAFGDRAAALRIARMQLAGDADEKALATLRDVADLDAGERDEATIIRARALLALDRPDEASALLRTSTDPRADRLKARIAIADDDTDTILREIPPLLASTDAASLDESQYANAVVSLALAHAGRGDAQEVRQLVPDHEDRPLDDRNRALLQTLASLTRERNAPATLDDLNGVDTSALRRFLD